MPLLKRIEKRLSKREREDELGITELKRKMKEMKEETGEADDANSDSESSGSDDSDDDSDDSDDEEGVPLSDEDESSSDEDEELEDEEIENEALAQSEEEDEDEPIPLESVLENPIYSLAEQEEPEIASEADETEDGEEEEADSNQGPMGCMLCPNKVLKNEKMVEVHLNSKPHKRSAARFAKKIDDPTFDRSQVIDPRDISIQIEEEIRASKNSHATPQQRQATNKSRPVPSKPTDPAQATEVSEVKPKRQRAWKEARKEAKRRRVEAKETGQPPRKQLEREEKTQERVKPNKTGDNQREISAVPKKGSKKVTKQEARKSKVSEASKSRN